MARVAHVLQHLLLVVMRGASERTGLVGLEKNHAWPRTWHCVCNICIFPEGGRARNPGFAIAIKLLFLAAASCQPQIEFGRSQRAERYFLHIILPFRPPSKIRGIFLCGEQFKITLPGCQDSLKLKQNEYLNSFSRWFRAEKFLDSQESVSGALADYLSGK